MSRFSDDVISTLLNRSRYKCEYCKRRLTDTFWEIDHILSRSHGGTDDLFNLAVCCPRCNRNKGEVIEAVDPVSKLTVPLFNPRTQIWDEHFANSEGYLVGKTPIGRTTACLLLRTTDQFLPADLSWWPTLDLRNSNDDLYHYINHQRARRLTNRFSELGKELQTFSSEEIYSDARPNEKEVARVAFLLLELEMYLIRSNMIDVKRGIDICYQTLKSNLTPNVKAEIHNILSILLQQGATICALKGLHAKATQAQTEAAWHYQVSLKQNPGAGVANRLRQQALQHKYHHKQDPAFTDKDLNLAIEEASRGELRAITYLADDEISLTKHSQYFDAIAENIQETLTKCGYGQDTDYARSIVLRRRWWVLKFLAGDAIDLDLLAADIQFWRSINMKNEIRELTLLIMQAMPRAEKQIAVDMLETIRKRST